jgi:Coenzyme PQQ synthesis protein D (PqqD)
MTATLDRSVHIPEDVVFRELQGEAVILSLESSMYFGLDPIGTRIWELCATHGSLRAVWEAMQEEFDAPDDTLQSDLLALIDELSANGLVKVQ